jgi:O-antigen ligase
LFTYRFPFRPTPFDLLIAIFMATAVLSLIIAYDWFAALRKFVMLVASAGLYYMITSQPSKTLRKLPKWLGWFGAFIAVYFLFTHNWRMMPADFLILQKAARLWMIVTPRLPLPSLHPNQVGGLLAMLAPFAALQIYQVHLKWKKSLSSTWDYLIAWLVVFLVAVGLIMTSSRGAWLSVLLAASFCLSWLVFKYFARRFDTLPLVGLFLVCVVITLSTVWFVGKSGTLTPWIARLQNSVTANSRLNLYRDTLNLIADFPYTGSGLHTFAGVYSRYILSIPVPYCYYSHNFYLDILLEQGPLALLALLAIYLSTAFLLFSTINRELGAVTWVDGKRSTTQLQSSRASVGMNRALPFALLTSLLTLLLHGLIDDPLYAGTFGTPFLFLIPAMTAATYQSKKIRFSKSKLAVRIVTPPYFGWRNQSGFIARAAMLLLVVISVFPGWREIALANLFINVGDVSLADYELVNFPTGRWDERYNVVRLNHSRRWFDRALRYDPNNPTAHYRLGLIAYRLYDFSTAIQHLEKAQQAGLNHIGIRKNLAYSYVWSGQIAKAVPLLVQIPEAREELGSYVGWWRNLVQKQLSERARQAVYALDHPSALQTKPGQ